MAHKLVQNTVLFNHPVVKRSPAVKAAWALNNLLLGNRDDVDRYVVELKDQISIE